MMHRKGRRKDERKSDRPKWQRDNCPSGYCPYCESNKTFKSRKAIASGDQQLREHFYNEHEN